MNKITTHNKKGFYEKACLSSCNSNVYSLLCLKSLYDLYQVPQNVRKIKPTSRYTFIYIYVTY